MRGINKQTMLDLIIEAKRNDPETGSFAEWLAEYLAEHMPTLTPPNEPLTLEQLREMDDEPVWCCPKNDSAKGSWMIVGPNGCENITSFAIYDDYGTGWLAYRRPPEVSP